MSKIYFKKAIVVFISVVMLIGIFPNFSVSAEDVSNLQPVDSTYAFIKSLEGYSSECFWDVAQWTIGYGNKCPYTHTSNGVRGQKGRHTISESQARELFSSKLFGYVSTLRSNCKGLSMTQNQFDALLSATYNHGNVNNCPLKYYLQGKLTESEARAQYYEWCINAGTADEKGLRNRRKKEADLFFSNPNPNPPTWAKVSLWKSYYMVGEDVNFEMTSDTGNVFTLGIDDEYGNRLYTYDTGFDNPSTTKNYTKTFDKAGKYSCWITTYNDAGRIDSERFYFTIYDEKPSAANINLYKNSYMVGEDVTFEMSSDSGFVFTLGIDDENGNRIHTYDTGLENVSTSKEYTCSFDTPGRYSCWITTYNAQGSIDSERVYFVVYDKAPEYANADLWKHYFMIGEEIPFELSSDTGCVFTLGIDDKDGNRLHTYDTGFEHPSTHQIYQYTINEPGEYSCWLTTYNAIGSLDSERVYFTVYDKAPSEANVTLWKPFFMVDEEIPFYMSSDLGFIFTLGVDDADGKRVYTYDTGFE